MTGKQGSLHPWLALLRLRLLPSALGDILCGTALAGGLASAEMSRLLSTLLCSALLYTGGMVLNDVADAERDLGPAPGRPIPSGRISRSRAACLGAFLLGAALLLARGASLGLLPLWIALLVLSYDFLGSRLPLVGGILLGACRAFNLWFGCRVPAFPELPPGILWILLGYGLYILLTVAHGASEEGRFPGRRRRAALFLTPFLLPFLLAFLTPKPLLCLLGALPSAGLAGMTVRRSPVEGTGLLLRGICRFTFALGLGTGRLLDAMILGILAWIWPLFHGRTRWT